MTFNENHTMDKDKDIVERLKEATTHALMSAARDTVGEAAAEIVRLRVIIQAYARSMKASCAEINMLREQLAEKQ